MGRLDYKGLLSLRRTSWVLQDLFWFSVLQHENLLDEILLRLHVHVYPHRLCLHEHGRVRPKQRRPLHLRKRGVHK